MEFGLLGPLMVRRGEGTVPIPAGRQRVLLAALLLKANQAMSADELTELLWAAGAPATARKTLHNYVKRLRHALGDTDHSRIATRPEGYLISVGNGELDVTQFAVLHGQARVSARGGAWPLASAQLRTALALWRGEALGDVPCGPLLAQERLLLEEMRVQALEDRIDADLHLGLHDEVIVELRKLASAEPMRERLHALLMLALYRAGRRADSLAVYRDARRVLVSELAIEPGAELRQLHGQIQRADPALAFQPVTDAHLAGDRPAPVTPRQLPAAPAHFTGRAGELEALSELLGKAARTGGTIVISAISGTAGVGKTALAVQWAHQVADRFPDGQLYVNLRGYDPDQPMTAADALAGFLRALGVAGVVIPVRADERAALYRSLLAGRRMLIVADNAADVEQVRPLLPGTHSCVAVVTSRDSLGGLVARDGALRLDLDLMPPEEAVGLLRALIGGRVDADPGAAAALADQCSRLPLALRVAAELAVGRPAAPLADLVNELADQQRPLDILNAGGDPRTAVRAVFSWSFQYLDVGTARAFRMLGLHPGPDIDRYAAAALTGTTRERADQVLGLLARAQLIQFTGPGRYGMHDLLRAYARELGTAQDTRDERRAALTLLFDYYLHTAAAAMNTLIPAERHRRPHVPQPAAPAPPVAGPVAARAWLDAERAILVAVAGHAASEGWPGHAAHLAAILFRYFEVGGHYPEGRVVHTHALHAARQSGDRTAQADALRSLGALDARQGRYQQAVGQLRQALAIFREIGDYTGEARTLGYLGIVDWWQGRYRQAAVHLGRALAIFREIGDQFGQVATLNNLGLALIRRGRYRAAANCFQQALALSREIGYRNDEAQALDNLGCVERMQGRYQQAAVHHQQALAVFREIGHRSSEAYALDNLGVVERMQGRCQQAADQHEQALILFREIGDLFGEAQALNGIGETLRASGRPGHAHIQHASALSLASQIGDEYGQARAHDGLAHCHRANADPDQARRHWQEALAIYSSLGVPEADQVRTQLTTVRTPASTSRKPS
jgi:DNA-binding SARP family transcriptional activator/tetratricopeptide (TPR) repeat protein